MLLSRRPIWPHRLTVRTPGSHPGNRGSIPRGVTNKSTHRKVGAFVGGLDFKNLNRSSGESGLAREASPVACSRKLSS